MFDRHNVHRLTGCRARRKSVKLICAEYIRSKIENDDIRLSPLSTAIRRAISLLENLCGSDDKLLSDAQRRAYIRIFSESATDHMGIRAISQNLLPSPTVSENLEEDLSAALTIASALGDINTITALLKKGADLTSQNPFFLHPMDTAVKHGQLLALQELLRYGKPQDRTLRLACRAGHIDIVQVLYNQLKPSLLRSSLSSYGNIESLVGEAVASGSLPLVDYFLQPGQPFRSRLREAAFCTACSFGNLELITRLLDSGVDVNVLDFAGFTGIELAAENGELDTVKLLLERGFNTKHIFFHHALLWAAREGHIEVAKVLLDHGANIDYRRLRPVSNLDCFGGPCRTAVFGAAVRGEVEMFWFLIERGANLKVLGCHDRENALRVADEKRDEGLKQLLLNAGVCREE